MRIIDFFDNGVKLYPSNKAFVDEGGVLTYAEANTQVHKIAAAIKGHGYTKVTHIGILAPNSNATFITLLSLFRAEGVWLPINPRNSVLTNVDLLSRFECELLFYHSSYNKEVTQIVNDVPGIKEAICIDAEGTVGASLSTWMTDQPDHVDIGPEDDGDLFAIFPTGGTTGKSKGVMITHKNIATVFAQMFAQFRYHDDTNHLIAAPMTHAAGILGCLHFPRGGTITILGGANPGKVLKMIHEHKITHLFLPPTVLYMMLAHENLKNYNYDSLQHFYIGAAPTSLEKLKEAIQVFGPVMSEAYGQIESPMAITLKAPWDYMDKNGNIIESRLASVGRPGVFNRVAILDDDGKEQPRGTSGEICLQGDLVTPGYYKNPQATAEIRQFGWHHTGDVGIMDEEGFIRIVDRKKDMIITGGFNVFPNEIEQVLLQHPAVQDCSVIGIPDEKWGEAVKAIIQLKPEGSVTDEELKFLVRDNLGGVKTPKSIDFMDDLPRSPAGKILKTELRKPYWQGQNKAVS